MADSFIDRLKKDVKIMRHPHVSRRAFRNIHKKKGRGFVLDHVRTYGMLAADIEELIQLWERK